MSKCKVESVIKKPKMFVAILTISLAAVILVFISTIVFFINRTNEMDVVATVDGNPVVVREFKQWMNDNIAYIHRYFKQKYGVDDNAEFWAEKYNGESPAEMLKSRTLESIVKIKVEQSFIRENGFILDISYSKFLDDFEKENKRRKDAVKNHQVIFGPVQYGEREYFSYRHSNIIQELKDRKGKELFSLDEQEMKLYYDQNKERLYSKGDDIYVEKVVCHLNDQKAKLDEKQTAELKKFAAEIKSQAEGGRRLKDIAAYRSSNMMVEYSQESLLANRAKSETDEYSKAREEAQKLKTGQISDIIEEGNSLMIIKCTERVSLGVKPFEEVKEDVRSMCVNKKYDELISKRVEKAKVEINQKVYNKLTVR